MSDPISTSNEFRCDCRVSRWTTILVWACVMSVITMLATIGWCAP